LEKFRPVSVAVIAWASLKLPELYPKNKSDPVLWRPLLRFFGDGAANEIGVFGEYDRLVACYELNSIDTELFMKQHAPAVKRGKTIVCCDPNAANGIIW
jgi:hypothetical protein